VGVVGFAQGNKDGAGVGYGKTTVELSRLEAEQKADGRAAQGAKEEGILSFGLADNQTAENLMERDWAVITVLVHDPTIESPYEATKYRGARIVVERISDLAEIERLQETYGGYPGAIYVRVVEVLPMG